MDRVFALLVAGAVIAVTALPAAAQTQRGTELVQSRQRIVVTPGRTTPGPNSTRECEARLVQQYRPSGTVIVPVMHCWWQ